MMGLVTVTAGCAGPAYYREPIKSLAAASDEVAANSRQIYKDRSFYKHRRDVITAQLLYPCYIYEPDSIDSATWRTKPKLANFASFATDVSGDQETAPRVILKSASRKGDDQELKAHSNHQGYFNPRRDRPATLATNVVGSGAFAVGNPEAMEKLYSGLKKLNGLLNDIAGTDYAGDANKAVTSLSSSLNTINVALGGSRIDDYGPVATKLVEAWIQGEQRRALHEAIDNLVGPKPPEGVKSDYLLREISDYLEANVLVQGRLSVNDILETRNAITQVALLDWKSSRSGRDGRGQSSSYPLPLDRQLLVANECWRYENEAADYLDYLDSYEDTLKKYNKALDALWDADQTGDFIADLNAFADFLSAAADLKEAHLKVEEKQ